MIYQRALDDRRPYDSTPRQSWPAIVCDACKRPAVDHGPLGECIVLRRPYMPYSYTLRSQRERVR